MDRRTALFAAALAPLAARAQPAGKAFQVGLVANSIPTSDLGAIRNSANPAPKIIEDGLRELGWIDGKNIRLIWKTADGNYDRWAGIIEELVRMRVDVLVVFGSPAAKIALEKTNTIPIVVSGMGLLLEPKIIDSLKRPGVNLTGMSLDDTNLGAKRIELLKAAAPSVSRVALLDKGEPVAPGKAVLRPQSETVARNLRIETFPVAFRSLEDLPSAFSQIVAKRANGMLVGSAPHLYYREYQLPIHEFTIKQRIPAMYQILNSVDSGGLMAYAADILDFYRAVPRHIDKILRGARAGEIPIETPTKFQFLINLRTARAMGITIPSLVLSLADRVVE